MKKMLKSCIVAIVFTCFFVGYQNQSFAQVVTKEEKIEQNKIEAKFPQFEGIENVYAQKKINMDIKVLVAKFIDENKKNKFNKETKVNYKIHYIDEEKVSFEIEMYAYNGGAHGMTILEGYTYNLKTGETYALAQLFDFRPSEINQKIFTYAKENDVFLFSDFKGIKAYPSNFYLNKDGKPVILFQQYEIAPYSSGILKIAME